jgi:hypothetical protein
MIPALIEAILDLARGLRQGPPDLSQPSWRVDLRPSSAIVFGPTVSELQRSGAALESPRDDILCKESAILGTTTYQTP